MCPGLHETVNMHKETVNNKRARTEREGEYTEHEKKTTKISRYILEESVAFQFTMAHKCVALTKAQL